MAAIAADPGTDGARVPCRRVQPLHGDPGRCGGATRLVPLAPYAGEEFVWRHIGFGDWRECLRHRAPGERRYAMLGPARSGCPSLALDWQALALLGEGVGMTACAPRSTSPSRAVALPPCPSTTAVSASRRMPMRRAPRCRCRWPTWGDRLSRPGARCRSGMAASGGGQPGDRCVCGCSAPAGCCCRAFRSQAALIAGRPSPRRPAARAASLLLRIMMRMPGP